MLLLDKGYFDYDYEPTEAPTPVVDWESTVKTDEEVNNILSIFGMGRKQQMTTEEIQSHIIKQMEDK